ncbi:MAG: ferric reductase-like transmembrane domain-containing protein [Anaerolineae bacterium]
MNSKGIAIIVAALAIPLLWFIPLAAQNNSTAIYSQYLGSASLILMGITMLLATRIKIIEPIFGSLDRVYVLHKWLGVGAIATAYLHSTIDAEVNGVALVPRFADAAEEWGELAYNGLLFLIILSLITIIPYKLWKWSHRLIGLFFALAAAHYIYIEKPFAVFEPLGLYISLFCFIGVASYLYLLLPRILGINNKKYKVTEVVQHSDVAEIKLRPEGNAIKHKAGQFAFVNFEPVNMMETHPFTISSAPKPDGELSFRVKSLGSYTKRMGTALKPGMTARVSNPFGHFSLQSSKGPQVWIGAGIGITPFIAWAESLPADWPSPTTLYYCVPSRDKALYLTEFESIAAAVPNFNLILVVSGEDKRLSADRIAANLGTELKAADVYFCGPTQMRESLKSGLRTKGLGRSNFHYEEFEMRTGLGIMNWFRWFKRFLGI